MNMLPTTYLKEDCDTLNVAMYMSFKKDSANKLSSSNSEKDIISKHCYKLINNKDFIATNDHNQVNNPRKPISSINASGKFLRELTEDMHSQANNVKQRSCSEYEHDGSKSSTDGNNDDIESRLILNPEQSTNGARSNFEYGILAQSQTNVKNNAPCDYIDHKSFTSNSENNDIVHESNEDLNESEDCKFAEVLLQMMNKLNLFQSISRQNQVWKQSWTNLTASPEKVTERLLTIIEESVIQSDSGSDGHSALNLDRLTREHQNMCTLIENESIPECFSSPNKGKCERKAEVLKTPINKINLLSDCTSNMLINTLNSTAEFETLEAQCKIMFSKEDENIQCRSVRVLQPGISNNSSNASLKKLLLLCEQQMTSLDMSDCDIAKMQSFLKVQLPDTTLPYNNAKKTHSLQEQIMKKHLEQCKQNNQNNTKSITRPLLESPVIASSTRSGTSLNLNSKREKASKACNITSSLHELKESVLSDIAEKRRRCFITAMAMAELNSSDKNVESHERMESIIEAFLNMVLSCNDYYNYLQINKTFIHHIQPKKSNIGKSGTKNIENVRQIRKQYSNNEERCQNQAKRPKLFNTPKKSAHKQNIQTDLKKKDRPKLFMTPGNNCVSMPTETTGVQLIHNVQGKRNGMRHTLEKPRGTTSQKNVAQ